jgi:hypothetical protein
MSLIKKADVNNHLAARRKKLVFPFAPVSQPDATGYSGKGRRDTSPNMTNSGTSAVKKPQA